PWSYDNLHGTKTAQGYNRVVPKTSLHVIGMGKVKNTILYEEAVVTLPTYPYAIAAGGRFVSCGSLLVAGVSKACGLSNLCGGPSPSTSGTWLPANAANNSTATPYAVDLGCHGKVNITGDLTSAGSVRMPPCSVVAALQQNANPVPIPTINAQNYDPATMGVPYATVGGTSANPYMFTTPLTGWARSGGSLYVSGPVSLQGGALYVNGDLTVSGGITGTGAVFVSGTVQVGSGTNLSSNSSLALVANGDISLSSAGGSSNALEGLVYAGGSLTATNFTVVGSYVANQGNVQLTNSSAIFAPCKACFSLNSTSTTGSCSTFSGGLLVSLDGLPLLSPNGSITNVQVNASPLVSNPKTDNDFTWTLSYQQGGVPTTQTLTGTQLVSQLSKWSTLPLLGSVEANLIVNGPLPSGVLGTDWTAQAIAAAKKGTTSGACCASTKPSVSLSFNQFLDPMQQARIKLWNVISSPSPLP
ncbi:MAG TPA: hypothetical protein VGO93_10325, partial [Candidatus Xenobia bacterium]